MARYINTENARLYVSDFVCEQMEKIPTADVVEVKHGEWETTNVTQQGDEVELFHHHHEECKFGYGDHSPYGYDYCPHCGAKMKAGN